MRTRNVEFYSHGDKLVGTVYLPDQYKDGEKRPCIIPCSGFTGINAVYPRLISSELTKKGYVCLGFDYRGWAPSEGDPVYTTVESEYEDITNAYVYATQLPEVDPDNIALFGWGFAGPVVIKVAADNPQIKAAAVGNSWFKSERLLRYLLSDEEIKERAELAKEDRIQRVLTGKGSTVDCYFFNCPAGAGTENDYLTKTLSRVTPDIEEIIALHYGSKENFPPKHSWDFWDSMIRIDAAADVRRLSPRHLFVVYSSEDANGKQEAESVSRVADGNVELYEVNGSHNDWMFSDDQRFIDFSAALSAFFDQYLR